MVFKSHSYTSISNYSTMSRYCETGIAYLFQFVSILIINVLTIYQMTVVNVMINQNATDQEILFLWWDNSQILVKYGDIIL